MPAHHLIRATARNGRRSTVDNRPTIDAEGVLAVLAGASIEETARRLGVQPAYLADAVNFYTEAGQAALRKRTADSGWHQVHLQFANWATAEQVAATALRPALAQLHHQDAIREWWFIRKAPCWRLRLMPGQSLPGSPASAISSVLDLLVTSGHLLRWQETVYEPELAAFGMQAGMDIAHALFHADSRHILDYLGRAATCTPAAGRRELSLLLCTGLLRGAGQDWYEQGDIWHRVLRLRPVTPGTPDGRLHRLAESMRLLLTADTHCSGELFGPGKPLAFAAPWITSFDAAGHALRVTADTGALHRGLRSILAHHIIFHWNRLGLTGQTQAILASAAYHTIMNEPEQPTGPHNLDSR